MKKITNTYFLKESRKTHGDLDNYDFSSLDVTQRDNKNRITIICKKHGPFQIRHNHFMNGQRCPYCTSYYKSDEQVREELSLLHPELDFSETKYSERDKQNRIKVICPIHGKQYINYYNLKNGQGCGECRYIKSAKSNSITNEEFIQKAKQIHGEKYEYTKLNTFERINGKVIITCPLHGDFLVSVPNFLKRKSGCPICNQSHLENEITIFLQSNNISYVRQFNTEWLNRLKIDFYLTEFNIAIECQGGQHFYPIKHFGGEDSFNYLIRNDKVKFEKCKENNVDLIYFSHHTFPLNQIYTKENTFSSTEDILNYIQKKKENL